jgi:pimeloyl-ACP methyl ester carboxylesterase
MPALSPLTYKSSQIKYYRFGKGDKLVICFHGYGEDGSSFAFLENFAAEEFTFIAFDLPFHGNTKWNEKEFTTNDLVALVDLLLHEVGFKSRAATFKLLGFSLGGRIALSLYQTVPSKIDRLVLLAPDGLKINFWYWLATQTILGKKLFYATMKNPAWFFGFLKFLNLLQLVNRSVFKFVNYYIGDANVRQALYQRWVALRALKPNLKQIKKLIQKNSIQTRLIYGRHDRIILPDAGERFCKGIESNCKISVIHSGHQVLQEKHIAEILPALLD